MNELRGQEDVSSAGHAIRFWWWMVGAPGSGLRRWKFFYTGLIMPAICIGAALMGMTPLVESPWQSGLTPHYVALLFYPWTLAWSLPLVLFSVVCLIWWLLKPSAADRRVVRLGIYSGAILATQYLLLVLICVGDGDAPVTFAWLMMFAFGYAVVLAFIGWAVRYASLRWRRFSILHLVGLTTVSAGLVSWVMYAYREYSSDPNTGLPGFLAQVGFGYLFASLIAGTVLNCVTYWRAASEVFRRSTDSLALVNGDSRPWLFMWTGWLSAWAGGWKISVDRMLVEYAALPTTDPNCYVSSAAANGHRSLVDAEVRTDGVVVSVQMRRLKFLEFALAAAAPWCHGWLRRGYNIAGPRLARTCRLNVWFADATYLALKPLEWMAIGVQIIGRVSGATIDALYGKVGAQAPLG